MKVSVSYMHYILPGCKNQYKIDKTEIKQPRCQLTIYKTEIYTITVNKTRTAKRDIISKMKLGGIYDEAGVESEEERRS